MLTKISRYLHQTQHATHLFSHSNLISSPQRGSLYSNTNNENYRSAIKFKANTVQIFITAPGMNDLILIPRELSLQLSDKNQIQENHTSRNTHTHTHIHRKSIRKMPPVLYLVISC